MIKRLLFTIRTIFSRRKIESTMKMEMNLHMQMQADEYIQTGMSEREAHCKAKRVFGNQTFVEESCRASLGVRLWDEWMNDFGYAVRQLRKHPGFTSVAVLSIAIGMGVNTALLSTLNGILFKQLPVDSPEQLLEIQWIGGGINGNTSGMIETLPDGSKRLEIISYPVLERFQEQAEGIADIFSYSGSSYFKVQHGSDQFMSFGLVVSHNFFRSLGVETILGRTQLDLDAGDLAEQSVWLSYSEWVHRYAGDLGIVGESILISGRSFTILGVLPESFYGVEKGRSNRYYFPLEATDILNPWIQSRSPTCFWLRAMARLHSPALESRLKAVLKQALLNEDISFAPSEKEIEIDVLLSHAATGTKTNNQISADQLKIPLIMAGILLLVCCMNLAGLQFARGCRRVRELSIRSALGATRVRLIRQMFCETLLFSIFGVVMGVVVAYAGHNMLVGQFVRNASQIDTSYDVRIILLMMGVTLMCVFLVGFLPAWWVSQTRTNLHIAQHSTVTSKSMLIGKVVISIQIAFALILAVAAGLFTRTLINLYQTDTGFDTNNLLVFSLEKGTEDAGLDAGKFQRDLQDAIAQIPQVSSVAYGNVPLLSRSSFSTSIKPKDFPQETIEKVTVHTMGVSSGFFETVGISIISGNGFGSFVREDEQKQIVINQTLADKAYPDGDAVGRTLRVNSLDQMIVGVCEDYNYQGLKKRQEHVVIFPAEQTSKGFGGGNCFYVRSQGDPKQLITSIRKVTRNLKSDAIVERFHTMDESIEVLVKSEKGVVVLSISFATITMLVTCIGLFALVNYDVSRRTQEIGIRMTFGATRKDLVKSILKNAMVAVVPGLVFGAPIALLCMRMIADRLHQVSIFDLPSFLIVICLILATMCIAVVFPALRTTRLDPAIIMRNE